MRFISLRTKLIVAFVAFVLLPILGSSAYAYRAFEHVLRRQIETAASERLNQINKNIERKLKTMMNATNSLVLDENVLNLLNHPPSTDREKLNATHEMDKKYLEMSTAIISSDVYFTLADNYGNLYTNWGRTADTYDNIRSSGWFKTALQENGYMVWTLNHPSYVRPNRQHLITVSMAIRDSHFQTIGVLAISEPTDAYLDILRTNKQEMASYGLLVGPDGAVLSDDPERALPLYSRIQAQLVPYDDTYSTEADGEKIVVSTYSLPLTGWRFIQIVPHEGIFQYIDTIRNTVSVTLVISMTVFVLVIIFFSSMLTRPLRKLRRIMKAVEKGNMDVSCDIRTRDEVGLLGRSFDSMLVKLRNHIENEIVLERHKEQAKLEALQAQINPHFLHNTLNTIRWMSIIAGTNNITEMLVSLGHLLDMSIHRGQEKITLREEMENVKYFMTIQKYRFGDKVQVTEHIAPETLEAAVPKLSLQPLVENVYRHAAFQDGKGQMTIRSSVDGNGDLLLEVIDNGLFVNKEKIREIAERISKERDGSFSGIGLQNVHKRVQMMFGGNYGVHMERREDEGRTYVSITLPLEYPKK